MADRIRLLLDINEKDFDKVDPYELRYMHKSKAVF